MAYDSHPYVAMAADVQEAYEIVRNPVRLQIAAHLLDHPDSSISELVSALGGQRYRMHSHLVELEQVGAVIASHPSGDRERRRVTYSLDRHRWAELLRRLHDMVLIRGNETQGAPND